MFLWSLALIAGAIAIFALLSISLTLVRYPRSTDLPLDTSTDRTLRNYYKSVYDGAQGATPGPAGLEDGRYAHGARAHATAAGIPEMVASFVSDCNLEDGRVLEVGAGSGLLQDTVSDYVGIDLSPTAGRFFHKPFVEASA